MLLRGTNGERSRSRPVHAELTVLRHRRAEEHLMSTCVRKRTWRSARVHERRVSWLRRSQSDDDQPRRALRGRQANGQAHAASVSWVPASTRRVPGPPPPAVEQCGETARPVFGNSLERGGL